MPAKGKSRVTDGQRTRIAADKLSGVPQKVTAAALGLSTETIKKQRSDGRTLALMASMKEHPKNEEKIREGFRAGLAMIVSTIQSKAKDVTRGEKIRAFHELVGVAVAGEQRIEVTDKRSGQYTYEELLTIREDIMRAEAGDQEAGKRTDGPSGKP